MTNITAVELGVVYFVGLGVFWLCDGWFRWTKEMYGDDKLFFLAGWPISMCWSVLKGLRKKIEAARNRHDTVQAERKRVRVAAEKELQEQIQTLEEELEENSCKKVAR